MSITSRTCILLAVLLLATAAAAAGDDTVRVRKWGLGWDNGLTLRRWVGTWELGVAAGPDDWLDESATRRWDTDEPDSLQGRESNYDEYRRESGFVRLQAGRRVANQGPLDLLAHANIQYRWRDQRSEYNRYYATYEVYDRTDRWIETWTASLAIRLAWRPLDALSIETAFGLAYSWEDEERVATYTQRDLDPPLESDDVTVQQIGRSTRRFSAHGWTGLGSLSFIYWF